MTTLDIPHVLHDDLYFAPPGSQIVDIEFYASPLRNKVKTDKALFAQVEKYLIPTVQYWQRVWKVYEDVRKKKIALSPEFNTFATRAAAFLMAYGQRVSGIPKRPDIKLCKGKEKLEYIYLKVTYRFTRLVFPAMKLSDRYGA